MMGHLRDLDLSQTAYNAYYDGSEILLIVPLGEIVPDLKRELKALQQHKSIPFSSRTWDLMLWPRTWNPKTKKYVIEVRGTDDLDKLSDMADKPIKRKPMYGTLIKRNR